MFILAAACSARGAALPVESFGQLETSEAGLGHLFAFSCVRTYQGTKPQGK
jgi:hypothetical protein